MNPRITAVVSILLAAGLLLSTAGTAETQPVAPEAGSQVLVTVGNREITAWQLEQAIRSSPMATSFNTLDEREQAGIRGNMLKDLVYSELLYQEALAQKIDQRPEIAAEIQGFRRGQLYRRYLDALRQAMPERGVGDAALKDRLRGEPDALTAARSASHAGRFAEVKTRRLLDLGRAEHLKVFRDRLLPGDRSAEAVVARGDNLTLRLGDLLYPGEALDQVGGAELLRRLDNRVEQELMVLAAQREGMDVSAATEDFRRDLLRQTLMKERERAWVPDRATLEAYYEAHPELSTVPELWHVVQLVTKSRVEAEALRERVIAGESLYRLSSEHSIDPYGREHAGDMGWLRLDQAPAALRDALGKLPDGTLSTVIETPLGFHLVLVEARKPAERKPLQQVAAGIRRSIILERLAKDFGELSRRYPIQWHLPEHKSAERTATQ